jgi:hypothetical protein
VNTVMNRRVPQGSRYLEQLNHYQLSKEDPVSLKYLVKSFQPLRGGGMSEGPLTIV